MIAIKKLKKRYNHAAILNGLNLEIREGETLVILGSSGVGKSVLLKQIIGIEKPDEGEIFVDGIEMTALKGPHLLRAIKQMGMLFQGAALFDSMTIRENTEFYLTEHADPTTGKFLPQKEIDHRVDKALAMVGLEGTQNKMPSELSGGMRKRAALARLIVYRPKIILYDEPTTGLDPLTSMQINELIVKTQQELQTTSIVVTHDMTSALYVGDRLALLKEGAIAYIDQPEPFMKIQDPIIDFLKKTILKDPRTLRKQRP